jgi:hypothetical protein
MLKRTIATLLSVSMLAVVPVAVSGCPLSPNAANTANTVLTDTGKVLQASEMLCILVSQYTSAPQVALACKIDNALVPSIEQFMAALDAVIVPAVADAGVGAAAPTTMRSLMLAALKAKAAK